MQQDFGKTGLDELSLADLNEVLQCVSGAVSVDVVARDRAAQVQHIEADPACLEGVRQRLEELLLRVEMAEDRMGPPTVRQAANSNAPVLSGRQVEILSWVAQGKSNNVIATILGISAHTVDTHLRRAFERLDTTDRTVAAIRAVQMGWIQAAA